jgi:hypothetical protein
MQVGVARHLKYRIGHRLLIRIGLGWYVPVAIAEVTVESRILAVCSVDQRKSAKESSKRQLTG